MRSLKTLAIATLIVFAAPVWAHVHLEKSVPANGATVQTAPSELKLSFEDEVHLTAVTVAGADGKATPVTSLPKDAVKDASVPLPKLNPGNYTVNWRAAGHDGHVMSGHVKFTIAPAK